MLAKRIVARLDVKAPNLVKGIRLEGFRVLGKPAEFAVKYDAAGVDELLFVDIVASLYGRNSLTELVEAVANLTFTPLCVGGGIRSVSDVAAAMSAGADKVAINTAALKDPGIITKIASIYGSQACVLSVEAKRTATGWEAYTDGGREKTGRDVGEWVREAVDRGAVEVLITSVDRDGARRGMDLALAKSLSDLRVPVVLSGGAGSSADVADAFDAGASAVAVGSLLHFGVETVPTLKAALRGRGVCVREAA